MKILLAILLSITSTYVLAVDVTFRAVWPTAVTPENIDSIKVVWRKGINPVGSFSINDSTATQHTMVIDVANNDSVTVSVQFFNQVGGGTPAASPVFVVNGLPTLPEGVGPVVVDVVVQ